MTTRTKNKNTTETIEQPELIQAPAETDLEQAEAVQDTTSPLTAEQKYYNAGDEMKRIKAELLDKRQAIEDHTVQIALVRQKHQEAKAAYNSTVAESQEYQEKILRQQALAKVGGPSEQATLQAMQSEQERLAKSTAFARQNLEETEKLLESIPAIAEDLERAKGEIGQLEHEQDVMESIQSEMLYHWGKEEQAALIAELNAEQEEFEAKEKARNEARDTLQNTQQSVRKRLRYWPGLADSVQETHLHIIKEEHGLSAEEHVFRAQIAFIRALGEWGPQCHVTLHHVYIAELLAIPRQTIAELMHPRSAFWQEQFQNGEFVRTNPLIISAESHIEEARSGRYQ